MIQSTMTMKWYHTLHLKFIVSVVLNIPPVSTGGIGWLVEIVPLSSSQWGQDFFKMSSDGLFAHFCKCDVKYFILSDYYALVSFHSASLNRNLFLRGRALGSRAPTKSPARLSSSGRCLRNMERSGSRSTSEFLLYLWEYFTLLYPGEISTLGSSTHQSLILEMLLMMFGIFMFRLSSAGLTWPLCCVNWASVNPWSSPRWPPAPAHLF